MWWNITYLIEYLDINGYCRGSHAAQEKSFSMRILAVQGSSNPKTSSSHSLSVSPTLNISALVVEAMALGLNSDHGKLLVNKGGQSSTFISKKHIDSKPNAMSGTDIKLNLRVNIIGEAFHGKNASLVDPIMKCRSHEGFKS